MPIYRLKPGQTHFMRDPKKSRRGLIRFEGGDLLDLDEKRASFIADKLIYVGDSEEEREEKRAEAEQSGKTEPVLKKTGNNQYSIVNKHTGKPINEKPLTLQEANELLTATRGKQATDEEVSEAEETGDEEQPRTEPKPSEKPAATVTQSTPKSN